VTGEVSKSQDIAALCAINRNHDHAILEGIAIQVLDFFSQYYSPVGLSAS
jgi:hypothetical protein